MQNLTVSDYISAIEPHISSALIAPENLGHIHTIARQLPGTLSTFFGFECRLGEVEARADFPICIASHQRAFLAEARQLKLPPDFLAEHLRQQLVTFAQFWSEPRNPAFHQVKTLWLEFDIDGPPPSNHHQPSIYLGSKDVVTSQRTDGEWITPTIFELLYEQKIPEAVQTLIDRCLANLPPKKNIFQMGAMLSRTPPFVRLCVDNLQADQIVPYLQTIGWAGDADTLQQFVDELSTLVDCIDVVFDVGEQIGPKIGFECRFAQMHSIPETEPRWYTFLDYLVDKGMCLPAKKEALIEYTGISHRKSTTTWPSALLAAEGIMKSQYTSLLYRGLHHVKLVYQDGQPIEAKAYPSVAHMWVLADKIVQSVQVQQLMKQFQEVL